MKMKPIQKTIKVKEDYYIDFTDEELAALKMEKGQKYSCEVIGDSLKLTPYVKIELEIGSWDREILEFIINESCEKDVSVNQVINDILEEGIKNVKL